MLKFTKKNGTYYATRIDGTVITIDKASEGTEWIARNEGDHWGDNTGYHPTLKAAKASENFIAEGMKSDGTY